jgi:hypothetical protein
MRPCKDDLGINTITVTAMKGSTLLSERIVYPCDSTKQLILPICENCMQEIFDTIFVP